MTEMTRGARTEYLKRTHDLYDDYNQERRDDWTWMASNGHPHAAAYRQQRRFFDGLKYACNSGARWVSFVNHSEWSQYWRPQLGVSWLPKPFGGKTFGEITPSMGDAWMEYLTHCASCGWPPECRPSLCRGAIYVRSGTPRLVTVLIEGLGGTSNGLIVDLHNPTSQRHFYAATKAIRKCHQGYVISRRPKAREDKKDD